jgi:hypothetical protein
MPLDRAAAVIDQAELCSSEISVDFRRTTRRYIQEDRTLYRDLVVTQNYSFHLEGHNRRMDVWDLALVDALRNRRQSPVKYAPQTSPNCKVLPPHTTTNAKRIRCILRRLQFRIYIFL